MIAVTPEALFRFRVAAAPVTLIVSMPVIDKGVAEAAKSTVSESVPAPPTKASEPPSVFPPAADKPETNVSLPDVPVSWSVPVVSDLRQAFVSY